VGPPTEVFASPVDEDVAGFVGVETVAQGRVRSVDDGVALVDVAGHHVYGGEGVQAGDEVLVCLRPEDVVLGPAPDESAPTSARNHLPARVTRIAVSGPFLRVYVDAGFPIVSLVTRHAVEELALEPGSTVIATFKATAVHLIPKPGVAIQEESRDG
jgi:molybdate transport system ATP-binding protein